MSTAAPFPSRSACGFSRCLGDRFDASPQTARRHSARRVAALSVAVSLVTSLISRAQTAGGLPRRRLPFARGAMVPAPRPVPVAQFLNVLPVTRLQHGPDSAAASTTAPPVRDACSLDPLRAGDVVTVGAGVKGGSAEIIFYGTGAHYLLAPGSVTVVAQSGLRVVKGASPKSLSRVDLRLLSPLAGDTNDNEGVSGKPFGGSLIRGESDTITPQIARLSGPLFLWVAPVFLAPDEVIVHWRAGAVGAPARRVTLFIARLPATGGENAVAGAPPVNVTQTIDGGAGTMRLPASAFTPGARYRITFADSDAAPSPRRGIVIRVVTSAAREKIGAAAKRLRALPRGGRGESDPSPELLLLMMYEREGLLENARAACADALRRAPNAAGLLARLGAYAP